MSEIALTVNGRSCALEEPHTLVHLLERLELEPATVLVELNGMALRRVEWEDALLRAGDRIELLRIAAGG